jgi:hypothetical protein
VLVEVRSQNPEQLDPLAQAAPSPAGEGHQMNPSERDLKS